MSSGPSAAPFAALLAVHVANVTVLLWLTMQARWPLGANGCLVVAWAAVSQWQSVHAASGNSCSRSPARFTRCSPPMR